MMQRKLAARQQQQPQPQPQRRAATRPSLSARAPAAAAPASSSASSAPPASAPAAAASRRPSPLAAPSPTTTAATATALLAAALVLLSPCPGPARAGLLPEGLLPDRGAAARERLESAERSFEKSGTLKALLERSEQNRDKNRRAIAAKTCARQAELGIGDCGGLKYVPGATQGGKQKTPEFLSKLLGTEGKEIQYEASGRTLQELLAADEARAVAREVEAAAAAAKKAAAAAASAVEVAAEAFASGEEAP